MEFTNARAVAEAETVKEWNLVLQQVHDNGVARSHIFTSASRTTINAESLTLASKADHLGGSKQLNGDSDTDIPKVNITITTQELTENPFASSFDSNSDSDSEDEAFGDFEEAPPGTRPDDAHLNSLDTFKNPIHYTDEDPENEPLLPGLEPGLTDRDLYAGTGLISPVPARFDLAVRRVRRVRNSILKTRNLQREDTARTQHSAFEQSVADLPFWQRKAAESKRLEDEGKRKEGVRMKREAEEQEFEGIKGEALNRV
ncbi:hypothetical protein K469DRAFT_689611 [Zopfia rhizophila CBS 207.26]|uniref:Uncharacterized protein n=1 Tax=Zopfia rhizophila CBS 207.26 TaxID=1314779 RepID=A0A6A6E067_9PEZI|nr:hypothetical protein K469DRAFT_689611 [Zopfia rhizophila CBS 207.26]